MKLKPTLILTICLFFYINVFYPNEAKAQAFEKGKSYMGIGYGIGFSWKAYWDAYDSYGDFSSSSLGPIIAKFDYGLTDKVSCGLYFAHQQSTGSWSNEYTDGFYNYDYNYEVTIGTTAVLGRLLYHLKLDQEKLDVYTGAGLGFRKYTYEVNSNDELFDYNASFGGAFGFGLNFGARYELTPMIGIYSEFGIGQVAAIQGGAVLKF